MTKQYQLTMSEEQAQILVRALDLYSRIGLGQFEEILQVYDPASPSERDNMRDGLNLAKVAVGHPVNGSHGIHNPKVRDEFRAAYDIQRVVRHRIAWDRNPQGNLMRVEFDEPHAISALPLPTVTSHEPGEPDANGFYYCEKHGHEQTEPCPDCKVEP